MKTIDIPKTALSLNRLLHQAREENLILRAATGEEFVLAELNDFDREIEVTRENRALMKFLDSRIRQNKRISMERIKNRLGPRAERKRTAK